MEFVFQSNKKFYDEEARRKKCPNYSPCPVCLKCQSKASHLYIKCQTCRIPKCIHSDEDRAKLIHRKNFRIDLDNGLRG